jgi:hypothetical protein
MQSSVSISGARLFLASKSGARLFLARVFVYFQFVLCGVGAVSIQTQAQATLLVTTSNNTNRTHYT